MRVFYLRLIFAFRHRTRTQSVKKGWISRYTRMNLIFVRPNTFWMLSDFNTHSFIRYFIQSNPLCFDFARTLPWLRRIYGWIMDGASSMLRWEQERYVIRTLRIWIKVIIWCLLASSCIINFVCALLCQILFSPSWLTLNIQQQFRRIIVVLRFISSTNVRSLWKSELLMILMDLLLPSLLLYFR